MVKVLGKPTPENLKFISNEHALKFIQEMPNIPKRRPTKGVEYPNELALDLIDKCLEFNPSARISVEQALAHPYFEGLHDPQDEPAFNKKINFDFETEEKYSLNEVRLMIIEEINNINSENGEEPYDYEKIKMALGI